MTKRTIKKRKYQRFDTEIEVYFRVVYDIRTKVKFRILEHTEPDYFLKEYSGISKNISVEGLCFASKKKLKKNDILLLEVYVPNSKNPVKMQGKVQWSKKLLHKTKNKDFFHTGVKVVSVEGKPVADSIRYYAKYKIFWSIVLETVFVSFKAMVRKNQ